jgi:hypothetical protein
MASVALGQNQSKVEAVFAHEPPTIPPLAQLVVPLTQLLPAYASQALWLSWHTLPVTESVWLARTEATAASATTTAAASCAATTAVTESSMRSVMRRAAICMATQMRVAGQQGGTCSPTNNYWRCRG